MNEEYKPRKPDRGEEIRVLCVYSVVIHGLPLMTIEAATPKRHAFLIVVINKKVGVTVWRDDCLY